MGEFKEVYAVAFGDKADKLDVEEDMGTASVDKPVKKKILGATEECIIDSIPTKIAEVVDVIELPIQPTNILDPKRIKNNKTLMYNSKSFTIQPMDISSITPISKRKEFVDRYIITGDITEVRDLVNVCSFCGRVSRDNICKHCYPYGLCTDCFSALDADGNCPECTPFGRCPICGNVRLAAGVCGQLSCCTQVPVIRCKECGSRIGDTGYCTNKKCVKSYEGTFVCGTSSCKQYCKAFCDNEDDHSDASTSNRTAACKLWGLHPKLLIVSEVMNFYMLWGLSRVYEDKDATNRMTKHVEVLDKEFIRYLDLAIGGELRHTMKYNMPYLSKIPKWLQEDFPCQQARPCAWLRWKDVRDEFGLDALRSAVECFMLPGWPHSFGGANWATIAKTLLDRLEDKIPPIVFIDEVWSLEHNCNCVLDKIYAVEGLKDALSICFSKKDPLDLLSSGLSYHISEDIKEIARKYEKKG